MAEQSGKTPGSPNNTRLKAYKNKGMDAQELRRRREEEGIQLRKDKRAQQVIMIWMVSNQLLPLQLLFWVNLARIGSCR